MITRQVLQHSLETRLSGEAERWLRDAVRDAEAGDQRALLQAYTDASRTLGRLPFTLREPGSFPPPEAAGLSIDTWTLEDAARLLFLLSHATARTPDAHADAVVACYEQGNAREQQSWLKGVAVLPTPERYLSIVIDACRTNILPQFEAVACGNPYPSLYFPERNFNQVVLKALFNGVRLERIVGLFARANAELARMATDYAAERTAAGRPVPADIGLAMTGAAA
jgi:hypothetical protein